jgi:hypothetical protein
LISCGPDPVDQWRLVTGYIDHILGGDKPTDLPIQQASDTLSEGFSYFVTSIAARAPSGWSVAGWDLHPLESAAFHGAPQSGPKPRGRPDPNVAVQ